MSRVSIVLRLLIGLVVVGALSVAGFFYYRYEQVSKATAEHEVDSLIASIGAVIELPNEKPTIATVNDPEKLAAQPFFKSSQAGDKVLIFTDAKKAILYRPSTKKIIDVTSIQTASTPTTSPVVMPSSSAFATPEPSVSPQ